MSYVFCNFLSCIGASRQIVNDLQGVYISACAGNSYHGICGPQVQALEGWYCLFSFSCHSLVYEITISGYHLKILNNYC